MSNWFKPQDFAEVWQPLKATTMQEAAHIANLRLSELLEQAPLVYKLKNGMIVSVNPEFEYTGPLAPTHKARLVNIELLGDSEQLEKK